MDYPEWEPHYRRIVAEFGFSPEADEAAARRLSELCSRKTIFGPESLARLIGEEVTVIGHSPDLEERIGTVELRGRVITADGATSALLHERGRVPDLIVTDLDGDVPDQIAANAQGAVAVILAHGDNVDRLERFVPWFSGPVTPTTQACPFDRVFNFGGFTDGDRAVMLARHFGAKRIDLLGFDLANPRPKSGRDPGVKKRKLEIARELIWNLNPPGVELSIL
jgi:uncharacterized Rossmann fold enzyme